MTDESLVNSGGEETANEEAEGKEEEATASEAEGKEAAAEEGKSEEEGKAKEGGEEEGKKEGKDGEEEKAEGAPETYADFTVPEGITVDPKEVEAFQTVAREFDLTQEQAQKLIDFEAERVQRMAEDQAELWSKTRAEWVEAAKSDERFGGKDFEKNVGFAKKALEKYGSPKLAELCDSFGIGDNPEFINLLVNVGKAMSEDGLEAGKGASAGGETSVAKRLFPSMK